MTCWYVKQDKNYSIDKTNAVFSHSTKMVYANHEYHINIVQKSWNVDLICIWNVHKIKVMCFNLAIGLLLGNPQMCFLHILLA